MQNQHIFIRLCGIDLRDTDYNNFKKHNNYRIHSEEDQLNLGRPMADQRSEQQNTWEIQ